jgi:hypothetical protein
MLQSIIIGDAPQEDSSLRLKGSLAIPLALLRQPHIHLRPFLASQTFCNVPESRRSGLESEMMPTQGCWRTYGFKCI